MKVLCEAAGLTIIFSGIFHAALQHHEHLEILQVLYMLYPLQSSSPGWPCYFYRDQAHSSPQISTQGTLYL